MPTCKLCEGIKRPDEMQKDTRLSRGHSTVCKECDTARASKRYRKNKRKKQDYDLQRNYGITLDDYDRMDAQQGGKCALCGTEEHGQGKSRFAVDHYHETGKVRALLCHKCNMGIGLLSTPDILRKAASYLEAK